MIYDNTFFFKPRGIMNIFKIMFFKVFDLASDASEISDQTQALHRTCELLLDPEACKNIHYLNRRGDSSTGKFGPITVKSRRFEQNSQTLASVL
jgi:hypothetical protein